MYRIAAGASADLGEIWRYVETESGSAASAFQVVREITSRFGLLATYRWLGRARDHDLGLGRRSFGAGRYVIVYRIIGRNIIILRVIHRRRYLAAVFGR